MESHHDEKAYETLLVLNLPAVNDMDRRGYAPRTAGCKPADFLTNLTALLKMARRLGAAPSPLGFGDRAAQAGARRTLCEF